MLSTRGVRTTATSPRLAQRAESAATTRVPRQRFERRHAEALVQRGQHGAAGAGVEVGDLASST